MTKPLDSTKYISMQAQDQDGTAYTVQLAVTEQSETGTLTILTSAGEVVRRFELSHLKKTVDGTCVTCHVSGASATLTLKRDKNQPELHVSASVFVPIFEAVYPLTPTEQERFIEWIKTLSIGVLASS
jgi:hypothetical protein